MLSNFKTIRVFISDDPIGVQLGGALKNPLAVGAGMVSAMGFGTNTLSAAVTRASNELRQLCVAMGANPRTIDGLAGMGDLMLTCFSAQSRNQRAGARLMTEGRYKKKEMLRYDMDKKYIIFDDITQQTTINYDKTKHRWCCGDGGSGDIKVAERWYIRILTNI
jgi:glycerol-3-phosphate dehydrogenase